jgi:hypothetical protein
MLESARRGSGVSPVDYQAQVFGDDTGLTTVLQLK